MHVYGIQLASPVPHQLTLPASCLRDGSSERVPAANSWPEAGGEAAVTCKQLRILSCLCNISILLRYLVVVVAVAAASCSHPPCVCRRSCPRTWPERQADRGQTCTASSQPDNKQQRGIHLDPLYWSLHRLPLISFALQSIYASRCRQLRR